MRTNTALTGDDRDNDPRVHGPEGVGLARAPNGGSGSSISGGGYWARNRAGRRFARLQRSGGSARRSTVFGGMGFSKRFAHVNDEISRLLVDATRCGSPKSDEELIALDGTPGKSRLGGNAMIAASMAVLHAAAGAHAFAVRLPRPGKKRTCRCRIQIFGAVRTLDGAWTSRISW